MRLTPGRDHTAAAANAKRALRKLQEAREDHALGLVSEHAVRRAEEAFRQARIEERLTSVVVPVPPDLLPAAQPKRTPRKPRRTRASQRNAEPAGGDAMLRRLPGSFESGKRR